MPHLWAIARDRTLIEITITGIDELIGRIGVVGAVEVMRRPVTESVIHLEGKMKEYPPQRAGSSYRRTGTLGRRWTHEVTDSNDGITGHVGNNTVYGPYVQSQQLQARVHMEMWQTDMQVIEDEQDMIVGFFERAVEDALDG